MLIDLYILDIVLSILIFDMMSLFFLNIANFFIMLNYNNYCLKNEVVICQSM